MRSLDNDDREWEKTDWRRCWYKISSAHIYDSSKRCGVLIDGEYTESRSGLEKITYECDCVDKQIQDIVWGFVLSERNEPEQPTPLAREPPPLIPRAVAPRVKVVMQHQTGPSQFDSSFAQQAGVSRNTNHSTEVSEYLDPYDGGPEAFRREDDAGYFDSKDGFSEPGRLYPPRIAERPPEKLSGEDNKS